MDAVARAADGDGDERRLYMTGMSSLKNWRASLGGDSWPVGGGEGFALMLALDASDASTDLIGEVAAWCIGHGLFAVSAWGEDCERVHDILDEIDVHLGLAKRDAGAVGRVPVVMTSWHADEPTEEALDFFWSCSIPDQDMRPGPCRIAIAVGDGTLEDQIRRWAEQSDL